MYFRASKTIPRTSRYIDTPQSRPPIGGDPSRASTALPRMALLELYRNRSMPTPRGTLMKRALIALALVAAASSPAFAQLDLAKSKNCLACHAVDKKVVGPAY